MTWTPPPDPFATDTTATGADPWQNPDLNVQIGEHLYALDPTKPAGHQVGEHLCCRRCTSTWTDALGRQTCALPAGHNGPHVRRRRA